jgi:hypothetical protein
MFFLLAKTNDTMGTFCLYIMIAPDAQVLARYIQSLVRCRSIASSA